MKVPREIEIQDEIEKRLSSYDINPYSIICSFAFDSGIVSITFYLNSDLLEFLDILDYKNQCDKINTVFCNKVYNLFTVYFPHPIFLPLPAS